MKEIIVNYENIKPLEDGTVQMDIRTGDENINVGEYVGGAQLLSIKAYGYVLNRLEPGLTARITLSKMPTFIIQCNDYPEFLLYLSMWRKSI